METLDIDGDGSAEPLTDGLLQLRYLFGFRGATLTTGAVDLGGCTRCDAASIEPHLAGLMLLSTPLAQEIRHGGEFQVNARTTGLQIYPSVAAGADGGFIVAWSSAGQDGTVLGVFARRFSSTGAALASEFQVNTYTPYTQRSPAVAASAAGAFVVAWESTQDGASYGIFAQRFSSVGAPVAGEFQVNTYTASNQRYPAVALDADGDFVIAWQSSYQDGSSNGVFAQRFSSAGASLDGEFQVDTHTGGSQASPSLASDADGDFVVTWDGSEDGSNGGVFARRFSSAGTPLTGAFQVNTFTVLIQFHPAVAASASGDFVVAWTSSEQDGSYLGVFARRFSSAGTALAVELQVNTYTNYSQRDASVKMDENGDFVIAWWDDTQDGSLAGVFAHRFSSAGAPLASEFQVNSYTSGFQFYPAVAVNDPGRFVIVWHDGSHDGSSYGIFAQRFIAALSDVDIDGDGAVEALTDGLLALRYLFGFRGATLINGAVGAGCTRCDAPEIEAHLAGLT